MCVVITTLNDSVVSGGHVVPLDAAAAMVVAERIVNVIQPCNEVCVLPLLPL